MILLLALTSYGAFLLRYASDAVGGSDSSGYALTARRLLAGNLLDRPRALDVLGLPDDFVRIFLPLGFIPGPAPGTTAPLYPVGFPAHQAAATLVFGRDLGPFLVNPLAAVLCLVILYFVGRELSLSRGAAALAAVLLAASPFFLFQAVQPMSDIVATFWALVTMWFALKSRRRLRWAIASGAALGVAILVRPSNALLVVPLLFALRLSPARLALFGMGGLPFAAILALVNRHCYGGTFASGYASIGLFDAFAPANFAPRLRFYGLWLLRTLTPLPLLAALALPFQTGPRWRSAFLASWFGVYLIFYSFYGPYGSFLFLRFLLPGIPGLLLAAVLGARGLLGRLKPRLAALAGAFALLLILWTDVRIARQSGVFWIAEQDRAYSVSCRWTDRNLPARSILIATNASGALQYYTDRIVARWEFLSPDRFRVLRSVAEKKGYRFFALLFPDEEKHLAVHAPGTWRRLANIRGLGVWELTDGQSRSGSSNAEPASWTASPAR